MTAGLYGWTMVVTGTGPLIELAQHAAYERVGGVTIPNARYRLDIGNKLILGQYAALEQLGVLD